LFVGFLKLDNGTPVFVNTRREVQHIYDLDIEGHKFRVVKTQGDEKSLDLWSCQAQLRQ